MEQITWLISQSFFGSYLVGLSIFEGLVSGIFVLYIIKTIYILYNYRN